MQTESYIMLLAVGYVLFIALVVVLPIGKILQRIGFSPLLHCCYSSLVNIIFLYTIASDAGQDASHRSLDRNHIITPDL